MLRFTLALLLITATMFSCKKNEIKDTQPDTPSSGIYSYKVAGLTGDTIDFAAFKGKKILIVNTASECSFTYQYQGLEALHKKYPDKLVIVGFPSNDFGHQEPGSNEEIEQFCQANYGVTFPMAAKVSVTGDNMTDIYKWLTQKDLNGFSNSTVKWNFQKYLIDESGQLTHVFLSEVEPDDKELLAAIEK